jgi:hypothetical protein
MHVDLHFFKYPQEWYKRSHRSCIFSFLKHIHTDFHIAALIYIPTISVHGSLSPLHHQHLLLFSFLMITVVTIVRWNFSVVLIWISSMAKNVEHFFIYLSFVLFILITVQLVGPFFHWWSLCFYKLDVHFLSTCVTISAIISLNRLSGLLLTLLTLRTSTMYIGPLCGLFPHLFLYFSVALMQVFPVFYLCLLILSSAWCILLLIFI